MRLVIYLPLVVPLLAAASSAVLGMLALTAVVRVPLVDVLGKMSGQVIRSSVLEAARDLHAILGLARCDARS